MYGSSFPVPVSYCPASLPARAAQTACLVFIVPTQFITGVLCRAMQGGTGRSASLLPAPVQTTVLCALKAAQLEKDLVVLVSSG